MSDKDQCRAVYERWLKDARKKLGKSYAVSVECTVYGGWTAAWSHLSAELAASRDENARLRAALEHMLRNPNVTGNITYEVKKMARDALSQSSAHASEPAVPERLRWPAEMTPALHEVLGKPNFWCIPLANALRKDGQPIEHKAEDEQAAVLFWLVGFALKYGDDWKVAAHKEIEELVERNRAAAPKEPNHD